MARIKRISAVLLAMVLALSIAAPVAGAQKKKITLATKRFALGTGEKAKIVVKNVPKKATVSYKSNNPSVASVTKKGRIRAIKDGTAIINIRVVKKKHVLKRLTCRVEVIGGTTDEPYNPEVSPKFQGNKEAKLSDEFLSQVRDFSVGLFRSCASDDIAQGKNALMSAQSVLTDMMMATNGAATTTKDELCKVMCGGVSFEDFRKSLSDFNAELIFADPVRFHIANSIWIRDDADRIQVKDSFIDAGETWYDAESYVLPFDAAMVGKVNDWVKKNTLGMIPELMKDPPLAGDVMHLINALAFEGAWAQPYDDYMVRENEKFTNAAGKEEKTTMLSDKQETYMHDDKAVGFARPYKGYDYSFVAILPNEDVGVNGYLKEFDGKRFTDFYKSTEGDCDVYTRIPEFTYDYSTELSAGLKSMGIREAFEENADFSEMATTKSGALYIGQVTHKTHIELDRNGTKAAAVTDIGMNDATSVQPEPTKEVRIYLDRPFIYAIVQSDTGIPIFMGVVNSVKETK